MRTSTIKSIAALALTGAGSALVLGFKTTGGDATLPVANSGSATSSSSGSASSSGSTTKYADGTWMGSEVSEPWGPFQVEVVISGGKITNVSVVESPGDRHSS